MGKSSTTAPKEGQTSSFQCKKPLQHNFLYWWNYAPVHHTGTNHKSISLNRYVVVSTGRQAVKIFWEVDIPSMQLDIIIILPFSSNSQQFFYTLSQVVKFLPLTHSLPTKTANTANFFA
jgi:hypothetical protein